LAKAATGSPKNIAPNRLMTTFLGPGSNGWHLGVALDEGGVGQPGGPAAPAGLGQQWSRDVDAGRVSRPVATRAAARVETPGTAADVEHPVGRAQPGGLQQRRVERRRGRVEAAARAAQSSPSAPFQAPAISALRASTRGGCGGIGTVIAVSRRRGLDLGWSRTATGLPTPCGRGLTSPPGGVLR
jgi:hypothetical protein